MLLFGASAREDGIDRTGFMEFAPVPDRISPYLQ
jgi:hypothetical protein